MAHDTDVCQIPACPAETPRPAIRWPETVMVYGCFWCQGVHSNLGAVGFCQRKGVLEEGVHYVIKNYRMSD